MWVWERKALAGCPVAVSMAFTKRDSLLVGRRVAPGCRVGRLVLIFRPGVVDFGCGAGMAVPCRGCWSEEWERAPVPGAGRTNP
jgi:hypothetical protein